MIDVSNPNKNPVETLSAAKVLLSDRNNWVQRFRAVDRNGKNCHPGASQAVAWDIESAVGICDNPQGCTPLNLLDILDKACRRVKPIKLTYWNRDTGEAEEPCFEYLAYCTASQVNDEVDHETLLKILDEAIKIAREDVLYSADYG